MVFSRRKFVAGLVSVPICTSISESVGSEAQNVSSSVRHFDIGGYDLALLPREHGQLTGSSRPIIRRYPSRDHSMQMAAFFRKDRGLLIYTKDGDAGVSDWDVRLGDKLSIRFYGPVPDIAVVEIEPTIDAAAIEYRSWALQQTWVRSRRRSKTALGFISVASNPDVMGQRRYLEWLFSRVPQSVGVWFTQWRRFPFDQMYPNYSPGNEIGFGRLQTFVRKSGGVCLPYFNGLLWDDRLADFRNLGDQVGVRDASVNLVGYNTTLPNLKFACPDAQQWVSTIVQAFLNVKDSDGEPPRGIYLDMLLAAQPIVCWSSDHGHEPGDVASWVRGVRRLLGAIDSTVMVEGCAEPYLDLIDYPLMHLYNQRDDAVALWSRVYGDVVQPVGWTLPDRPSASDVKNALANCQRYGVTTAASPWMTRTPEQEVMNADLAALVKKAVMRKKSGVLVP